MDYSHLIWQVCQIHKTKMRRKTINCILNSQGGEFLKWSLTPTPTPPQNMNRLYDCDISIVGVSGKYSVHMMYIKRA